MGRHQRSTGWLQSGQWEQAHIFRVNCPTCGEMIDKPIGHAVLEVHVVDHCGKKWAVMWEPVAKPLS